MSNSTEKHCALRNAADGLMDWLLVILISIVALLVFVQVILRYIFHAPLMGIEELLLFPTTWLFMIGAVRASSEKTQIVARVLEVFLKTPRAISLVRTIASFFTCMVLLWLSYWGYDYFKYLLRMQKESPTLYLPTIWYEGTVFIALILMFVYSLIEMFENFNHFKNGTAATLQQEGE
jgi:TRAP-type C4-dicarboxylate transport system permease small subunit